MSRTRTIYRCRECGHTESKWAGRCPACSEWSTLEEEVEVPAAGRGGAARPFEAALPIDQIDFAEWVAVPTGLPEVDRVLGLEMGADDYVTKPFSPRELVARVRAILRRAEGPKPTGAAVHTMGAVEVDTGRREARLNGVPVALATREFDLLQYLAEHQGLALSRRQLLDGVWGADWIGDDRTVDVHVRQLRKKFGDLLSLDTVWGVGYRMG